MFPFLIHWRREAKKTPKLISSSASLDLEMLATKEDSNAKILPVNKQERETVKVEYSSTFEPQKASDVIKPIPIEKGPSITPAGKDTDVIKPMPIDKAPSITPAGNSTDVIKQIPIDKAPSITSVKHYSGMNEDIFDDM